MTNRRKTAKSKHYIEDLLKEYICEIRPVVQLRDRYALTHRQITL